MSSTSEGRARQAAAEAKESAAAAKTYANKAIKSEDFSNQAQASAEVATAAETASANAASVAAAASISAQVAASTAAEQALEQTQQALDEAIRNAGYVPVLSFEKGATLTSVGQALQLESTGAFFSWRGPYDKVVPPGSTPTSTGGISQTAWVDVTDITLRSEMAGPDGANLSGFMQRTVAERLLDDVYVTDYYYDSDGGNWHNAFMRCFAIAKNVWCPDNRTFIVSPAIDMPSDRFIRGSGGAVISSPPATDVNGSNINTVIKATNVSNIGIDGVIIDGGVREIMTGKNYTRPVQIVGCLNVIIRNTTIINNADWSFSLESCTGISIDKYTQRSYTYQDSSITTLRAGGRDGGHLMDCVNALLTNLDIESGDDCIGITSKLSGCKNITVRALRGTSVIASLCIYNEEGVTGTTDYYAMPADQIIFDDIRQKNSGSARNVVRIAKYNPLSTITNCSVTNVSGIGYNHGAALIGIDGLFVSNVDVSSTGQHGAYISNCNNTSGNIKGRSYMSSFDGVNISGGANHNLDTESYQSSSYGAQINGLTNSVIRPKSIDCGAVDFANSRGGGIRIVNCSNVDIPTGLATGDKDTSYFGINFSTGNTNVRIGSGVQRAGYVNNTTLPVANSLQQPYAAFKLKEDSGGNLIYYTLLGCSVVRNSVGNYTVTFDTPMRSTGFLWFLDVHHVNAVRTSQLSTAMTINGFSFVVKDASSNNAYSDHINFLAYNT